MPAAATIRHVTARNNQALWSCVFLIFRGEGGGPHTTNAAIPPTITPPFPKSGHSCPRFGTNQAKYCRAELGFALLYMLLAIIEYPACFEDVPLWLPVSIELICLAFFVVNLMLRAKVFFFFFPVFVSKTHGDISI